MLVAGDAVVAEGAQERGVVLADQAVALFVSDGDAVAQEAFRAEVPAVEGEVEAVPGGSSRKDLRSRPDDLGADPVPSDQRDSGYGTLPNMMLQRGQKKSLPRRTRGGPSSPRGHIGSSPSSAWILTFLRSLQVLILSGSW